MTVDERRKKKGRSDGIIIAHSENLIRKVVRNMPHYDPSDTRFPAGFCTKCQKRERRFNYASGSSVRFNQMVAKSVFRAEQIQNSSLPLDFVCDPANCYICHSVRVNKRLDALALLKRGANQIEVAPRLTAKKHELDDALTWAFNVGPNTSDR